MDTISINVGCRESKTQRTIICLNKTYTFSAPNVDATGVLELARVLPRDMFNDISSYVNEENFKLVKISPSCICMT